jgi:autotransporter passenger strand-loop-strand repeat protein
MTTIIVGFEATTVVSTSIPPTTNYIVESLGTLNIVSGGVVSGLITISAEGTVKVSSGGTVLDTLVSSGGVQNAWSGGVLSDTVIDFNGLQQVINGGAAIDTAVENGGVEELFNGRSAAPTPPIPSQASGTTLATIRRTFCSATAPGIPGLSRSPMAPLPAGTRSAAPTRHTACPSRWGRPR